MAALIFGAPAAAEEMDDDIFTVVHVDQLEYRIQDGSDLLVWEGQVRGGNDDHALALKSHGEYERDSDKFEAAEFQLLYQRPVSDFFDLQAGVRHDFRPRPNRTYAALGLNGLAPHWFEVDMSVFVSEHGDASARFEVEYDILLTQRLVLQPAAEVDVAFSEDRPTDVGTGLASSELGLRLRYELLREFAPYVGVNWERKFGDTARFTRDEGGDTNTFSFVLGTRLLF